MRNINRMPNDDFLMGNSVKDEKIDAPNDEDIDDFFSDFVFLDLKQINE